MAVTSACAAAAFRDITIASISGSSLSLKTDDGWTRTITPTSATTITKAGATITVSDLEVGDQIVFSQTKQTDGTYTIDAIRVVLPHVGGQVSAVSGSTITVTERDGTTATIHVDSATTYQVEGVTSATLSDIKVGDFVVAQGDAADGWLARRLHGRQRVPRRTRQGRPRPRHGARRLEQRRRGAQRLPFRDHHAGLTSGPLADPCRTRRGCPRARAAFVRPGLADRERTGSRSSSMGDLMRSCAMFATDAVLVSFDSDFGRFAGLRREVPAG